MTAGLELRQHGFASHRGARIPRLAVARGREVLSETLRWRRACSQAVGQAEGLELRRRRGRRARALARHGQRPHAAPQAQARLGKRKICCLAKINFLFNFEPGVSCEGILVTRRTAAAPRPG